MFIINKEYRVVSIITTKYIVNMFIFFSLIFYYLNYINVFYYYAKTILLDNLGDLL